MTLDPRPLTQHPGNPHGYPDFTWPMVWVLQDGELWPIEQWVAHVGVEKLWMGIATILAGSYYVWSLYTIPAGKKLYVVDYTFSGQLIGFHSLYYQTPTVFIRNSFAGAYACVPMPIHPPATVEAGKSLVAYAENRGGTSGQFTFSVQAFELDV